jgi:hypothetical protein
MGNKKLFLKLQCSYVSKGSNSHVYRYMDPALSGCCDVHLQIQMLLDRYINAYLEIYGLAQVFWLGC